MSAAPDGLGPAASAPERLRRRFRDESATDEDAGSLLERLVREEHIAMPAPQAEAEKHKIAQVVERIEARINGNHQQLKIEALA